MEIRKVTGDKKEYLELLLLADEQEDMIDKYLGRGDMFILDDGGVKAECVVTKEEDGIYELKNIAVLPECQRKGYGRSLISFICGYYPDCATMFVGTGDVPSTLGFYTDSGFTEDYRKKNFFTDNYDHLMFEDGIQLVDMVYLKKEIRSRDAFLKGLTIKKNELTAEEFLSIWDRVWGDGPSLEQTELAMKHTLFRISVYDGEEIIAMARMLGDMGMDYYIKDVAVLPEYQRRGVGRLLIEELMKFVGENGVSGTGVFVELCASPDKIPFYEKLGFDSNEAQRLKMMYNIG